MFKGVDRAKYDLNDPSAWHSMKRDRALHEEALRTVARHLDSKKPTQRGAQIPLVLLPPDQQAELDTQLPAVLQQYERSELQQLAMLNPIVTATMHK